MKTTKIKIERETAIEQIVRDIASECLKDTELLKHIIRSRYIEMDNVEIAEHWASNMGEEISEVEIVENFDNLKNVNR